MDRTEAGANSGAQKQVHWEALLKAYDADEVDAIMKMERKIKDSGDAGDSDAAADPDAVADAVSAATTMTNGS
jgi:hypothetical protein